MNNTLTLMMMVAVGLVVAVVAFNYFNTPEPLSNRMEGAVDNLGAGRMGEAMDELNNQTRGEAIADDMNDLLTPSPSNAN